MNKELVYTLNQRYVKANLNFLGALRVWNESSYTPEEIQNQIKNDIDRDVTAQEAEELYHVGASLKDNYESIVKPYEVSKGRADLIPANIKNKSIKMSPAIKMAVDKIGQNLFRHKTAKTYWTMKEKTGDNGEKAIYLVAVDEPDDMKKTAEE